MTDRSDTRTNLQQTKDFVKFLSLVLILYLGTANVLLDLSEMS